MFLLSQNVTTRSSPFWESVWSVLLIAAIFKHQILSTSQVAGLWQWPEVGCQVAVPGRRPHFPRPRHPDLTISAMILQYPRIFQYARLLVNYYCFSGALSWELRHSRPRSWLKRSCTGLFDLTVYCIPVTFFIACGCEGAACIPWALIELLFYNITTNRSFNVIVAAGPSNAPAKHKTHYISARK